MLKRRDDAVTFVGSRHLGRNGQMLSVLDGYCQASEDALLDSVGWAQDVDFLFDVTVWAGVHRDRDAFVQNESSAIAISRQNWDRLGGYNEGFARPGGGLYNLELFDRIRADRDLNCISLLAKATFHQVHGGAATSKLECFAHSLEEHRAVAGREYELTPGEVLFDLGLDLGRAEFARRVCLE